MIKPPSLKFLKAKAWNQLIVKLTPDSRKGKQMILVLINSKILRPLVSNQKLRNNLSKWSLTDVFLLFHHHRFFKQETNGTVPNANSTNLPKSNWTFTEHLKYWSFTLKGLNKEETSKSKRTNHWFISLKLLT